MRLYPKYHYEHFKAELPYNYQHRCFKLLLEDEYGSKQLNSTTNQSKLPCSGRWLKVWRVRSADELRQKLIKFHPVAAYISTSTYLDPLHVSMKWKTQRRGEYKVLENVIMTSDFVPDFDDYYYAKVLEASGKYEMVKVKTDPREDITRAYWYLKGSGFGKFKFVNTNRGFHLWVLDFYERRCQSLGPIRSHEREIFILNEKRRLADELLKNNVHFDYKVAVDTRRVTRLWNSLHNNGFTLCNAYDNLDDAIENYNIFHKESAAYGANRRNAQGGPLSSEVLSLERSSMTSNEHDGRGVDKGSFGEETPDSALLSMGRPTAPHYASVLKNIWRRD